MQHYLHMVKRPIWLEQIQKAWDVRPIVWLAGVRRAGKTVLCQSIADAEYFDCELPRTRRLIEDDPEAFLESVAGRKIVLDEVHRLKDPAGVLKIAADHFPQTRIVATGSSTLGASRKFCDTLTGRKAELWLTPILCAELKAFGNDDIGHRMLHGGLPPFFLAPAEKESAYQEWLDSFWARDIQELFRLERHYAFQRFVELLLSQSGVLFEATRYAAPCEISRTTVSNYLLVLEATRVAHVIRPYRTRKPQEIVAAPKVYAFDTGFVCHFSGWTELRPTDRGVLWEHIVLNELQGLLPNLTVNYWRDKQKHEIDFVVADRVSKEIVAIECKYSSAHFDPSALKIFRRLYPKGRNYVVANDVARTISRGFDGVDVRFVSLASLVAEMSVNSSKRKLG